MEKQKLEPLRCHFCEIVVEPEKIRCFKCDPEVIVKKVKDHCVICKTDLKESDSAMLQRYLIRGNWCGPCSSQAQEDARHNKY